MWTFIQILGPDKYGWNHPHPHVLRICGIGPIRVAKCHGYGGYIRVKKLEGWGKKSGRIHSFAKSGIVLCKFEQHI